MPPTPSANTVRMLAQILWIHSGKTSKMAHRSEQEGASYQDIQLENHRSRSVSTTHKHVYPTPKVTWTTWEAHFQYRDIFAQVGMPNPAGCGSLMPSLQEKAIQKSGIWRHLFLSRCDQSGDLLLCFNSEVKGACGMRMGMVCVCVCVCVYRGIEESFAPWWDPMAPGWPSSPWCSAVDVCQGWLDVQRPAQVRMNADRQTLCDLFHNPSFFLHHRRHRLHKPLISVSLSLCPSPSLPPSASRLSGEDDDRFVGVNRLGGIVHLHPGSAAVTVGPGQVRFRVTVLEEFADFECQTCTFFIKITSSEWKLSLKNVLISSSITIFSQNTNGDTHLKW